VSEPTYAVVLADGEESCQVGATVYLLDRAVEAAKQLAADSAYGRRYNVYKLTQTHTFKMVPCTECLGCGKVEDK
jgi:hypothetical protein